MEFNGFKVTPVGDAKLSIENGILRVSNISDSGLDGVLININGAKGYNIQYSKMDQMTEHNAVLRSTSFMKNGFGEVTAFSESYKRYDKNLDRILFGINASYLSEKFNVSGILDGKPVFDIDSSDLEVIDTETGKPQYAAIPWKLLWKLAKWGWGIFSAWWTAKDIYEEIESKQTVWAGELVDYEGHLIGYEVIVNYDPHPFEIVINQKPVIIDEFLIKYKKECPEQFIDKDSFKYSLIGEQITACNMPYFEIKSISKL